jgi:hypothetical protein
MQKKFKARDLDSKQLSSQLEKTPETFAKKRMSSLKQGMTPLHNNTGTPQASNPKSRSKHFAGNTTNQDIGGKETSKSTMKPQRNSTENLFNLIQATKTKNTLLEPITSTSKKIKKFEKGSQDEMVNGPMSPRVGDEIGIGLQQSRMRKTEHGHRFINKLSLNEDGTEF